MVEYIHKQEGIRHYHLIKLDIATPYGAVFMDATEILQNASRADHKARYGYEDGPRYGIEFDRAMKYAEYVEAHATPYNFAEYMTKNYAFSILSDKFKRNTKKADA